MKLSLNKENIQKVIAEQQGNEHFQHIALPRLLALYAIKKSLRDIPSIKWYLEYNFVNHHSNRLILEYEESQKYELNLFYEIPLAQKFEFRAFLGTSSAHFIDIYNFLIKKNVIQENQFPLKAEYRTIPHFILNKKQHYDLKILHNIDIASDLDKNIDDDIQQEIKQGIEQFQPIFNFILQHFI